MIFLKKKISWTGLSFTEYMDFYLSTLGKSRERGVRDKKGRENIDSYDDLRYYDMNEARSVKVKERESKLI